MIPDPRAARSLLLLLSYHARMVNMGTVLLDVAAHFRAGLRSAGAAGLPHRGSGPDNIWQGTVRVMVEFGTSSAFRPGRGWVYRVRVLGYGHGVRGRKVKSLDGRRTFTLCSRSRCGAREAMTVGCKPTTSPNQVHTHAARAKGSGNILI